MLQRQRHKNFSRYKRTTVTLLYEHNVGHWALDDLYELLESSGVSYKFTKNQLSIIGPTEQFEIAVYEDACLN